MTKSNDKGLRQINGIWYVNIQVKGQRREFRVGTSKEEAIAVRSRLKLMAIDGTLKAYIQKKESDQPFLFRDAVTEHFEKHLKFKKSGNDMLGRLKPSLTLFETHDIKSLHWQDFEDYRNKRLSVVTPSTVKQELDLLHAVFERQIKVGHIKENPLNNVDRPQISNTREQILSHKDFLRLLHVRWEINNRGYITQKTIEPHLKLALVIADYTAMRISEVLKLKWAHIQGHYESIYIPDSKTKKKRVVPIHPELAKILSSMVRISDYVIQYKGNPVASLKKAFGQAREKSNLLWLHIHDLRHRAITRWTQASHPLSAIMKASGHSTFSAFSRYSNLKDGDVQILVGRKTEPLPVVTYEEFLGTGLKNVENVWKEAGELKVQKNKPLTTY
jgi:integrase